MNALRAAVSLFLSRLMFDSATIRLPGEPLPSVNANLRLECRCQSAPVDL